MRINKINPFNERCCGRCHKDFDKKDMIRLAVKGTTWYFCSWKCVRGFVNLTKD